MEYTQCSLTLEEIEWTVTTKLLLEQDFMVYIPLFFVAKEDSMYWYLNVKQCHLEELHILIRREFIKVITIPDLFLLQ